MRKHFALFVCFLFAQALYAQQETPSALYMRSLNSYVRGAPETSQMMKYIDYPVNLFTGTPNIDLPIHTLSGKGIGLSLSLSYHAGGGVKISDMSSAEGLGWLLSTGGQISREIRGVADELPGKGFIYKDKPLSYYDSIRPRVYDDPVAGPHFNEWVMVAEGNIDLEPDIFYFSFGGYSGKFIYDENKQAFVNMNTMDSRLQFTLGAPGSIFTVTTDNGTRYVFGNKEQSRTSTIPLGFGTPTPAGDAQITSWKLSRIVNADATDSIVFNYDYNSSFYYSLGSSTVYTVVYGTGNRQPVLNTYNKNMVEGYTKLKSIVSSTDSISLQYDAAARQDYPGEHALSKIVICSRGGGIKDIFKLHTSYFARTQLVGVNPVGTEATKSLRLDSLTEYGNSESNANPLRHRFTYNNSADMHNRFSFGQDMWGYANRNNYADHLAPKMYYPVGTSPTLLPGADRSPDETAMKAGVLEKIELPTGGFVNFEYEANTVSNPSLATGANSISSSHVISIFKAANQAFADEYRDSFIVDEEPDAAINGNLGGVIANISMGPDRPGATWYNGVDDSMPYFMLERATYPPLGNQPPFLGMMAQGPAYTANVYLPNGKYYMTIKNATSRNRPELMSYPVRNVNLAVTFDISDTAAASKKYMAGGLRIKRITSKDHYSGTAKVREFSYGGADTTWGRLIGPNFSAYYETRISNGDRYYVRMGSNSMPGQGSLGNSVVYPKVVELVHEGDKSYRTYHHYINVEPVYFNTYPFVPGLDNEYARGKEIKTLWTRLPASSASSEVVIKRTDNVYDYSGALMPTDPALRIPAIKTMIDAYSVPASGGTFPSFTITPYSNVLTHAYLTSDSMVTSDYDNGNQLKTWNSYTYGTNNHLPLTITSMDSKGSLIVQKNGYALDAAEPGLAPDPALAAQLDATNRVSEVLATRTYNDNELINQMFKHAHFSGSQFLMDSVLYAEYNHPLESDGKVIDYDTYGNPLTIEGRGSRFRKYIWRKERNLALATCSMPKKGSFVFTSFEYPNEYNVIAEGNRTTAAAFSGSYAYTLNGSMIFQGFNPAGNIEAYAWLSQGSFTVNGIAAVNTGRSKGIWTLYRAEVPSYATVTIAGSCTMDQLVIVPAGSVFEGNVYDVQDRVVSKVSANMQTTFFDYDAFSRLQYIRDEKGNIIKSNTYQYQVSQ